MIMAHDWFDLARLLVWPIAALVILGVYVWWDGR